MVKDKPDQVRTYDDDGYRRRAACICVKDETEREVLLVSSSGKPGQWVVPGGGVEPNEDAPMAAVREVEEEAGVRGTLGRCLGEFTNEERRHKTLVYVMSVNEELENWDDLSNIGRKRRWFSILDAQQVLSIHKPIQQQYLELLANSPTPNPHSSLSSPAPSLPPPSSSSSDGIQTQPAVLGSAASYNHGSSSMSPANPSNVG